MKFKLIVLSILFLFFANGLFAISFSEAKSSGLIAYSIVEQTRGTHYYSPLSIKLLSKSDKLLTLELDNGTLLLPADQEEQNFIVTDALLVQLKPNEEREIPIFAMCIEQSDRAPSSSSLYTIGGLADESLRKLSKYVEANKRFEPDAQFLMWDIAQGVYDPKSIDQFIIDEGGTVRIKDAQGNALEKQIETREEEISKPKLMVSGDFEMNFSRPKNVHIAMFNKDNVIVKELYKNPVTPIGKTTLAYEFNSYDYKEERYFVKLVVNGEVLMMRTIEMSY